jgi:hypothetical protein
MKTKKNNPYVPPGVILRVDGTREVVRPANGEYFTLKEMQTIVDGLIEILPTRLPDFSLVINEEGKLEDLPYNPAGTSMYKYGNKDTIVGDVLVVNDKYLR